MWCEGASQLGYAVLLMFGGGGILLLVLLLVGHIFDKRMRRAYPQSRAELEALDRDRYERTNRR